jgi:hypothetical protein
MTKTLQFKIERIPVHDKDDCSVVVGHSYETVITAGGVVHRSSRFYATDADIEKKKNAIINDIRIATVEIVK